MYKISVIVPNYNAAPYLEQCLSSLVQQTLSDIQVIVVDDGSTDSSMDVINRFQKYKNFKIISFQKNRGQGAARNEAIQHAKAEFIGFLDSDDWADPTMYEKMYDFAKTKKLEMVVCGLHIFNQKKTIKNIIFGDCIDIANTSVQVFRCYQSKIIDFNFWKKNNLMFWNKKFEDVHLYSQYFNALENYGYLNSPLYNYRRGHQSTAGSKVSANWLDLFDASLCVYKKSPSKEFVITIFESFSEQFFCSIFGLYFLSYLKRFHDVYYNIKKSDRGYALKKLTIKQLFACSASLFLSSVFVKKSIEVNNSDGICNSSQLRSVAIYKDIEL